MNFTRFFTGKIVFVFLFIFFSILSSGIQDYSLPEALKVFKAIEKIKSEQSSGDKSSLKKIVITESELNSYIAYRVEKEKEEIMKELRFKLFKRNKIEGKALINLRGQKISKFLRPQMALYFGGKIEVKDGKVRFDIKDLFLEEQRVELMIVDLIIYIASKVDNTEPWSIKDWQELPYQLKDIEIHRGEVIFYY